MSTEENSAENTKEKNSHESDGASEDFVEPRDEDSDVPRTEKPEVTDEHKEQAKEMKESYQEERDTISLPGSGGTVSGTAVNEWVDDDGNPKYGDDSDKDSADSSEKDSADTADKDKQAAE